MKNDDNEFDALMNKAASEAFVDYASDFEDEPYIHSGISIARVIGATTQMAAKNPEVENKTYIVSFPARIVTTLITENGTMTCLDRGYVNKKRKKL